MSMFEIAFEGKARSWLMLQSQVMTYSNFKDLFIKEFYSVPSQVKVKNIWSNRKYNDQYENFQNFYYKQLMYANYILPVMSEYERNYIISQQFPSWVRESLTSVNFENSNSVAQTLAMLDNIRIDRQRNHERKQSQNLNTSAYTSNVMVRQISIQGDRSNSRHYSNSVNNDNIGYQNHPRETFRFCDRTSESKGFNNFYYPSQTENIHKMYGTQCYQNPQNHRVNMSVQFFASNETPNINNMHYPNPNLASLPDTRFPPPRLNQQVDYTQNNYNHNNLHPKNLNISVVQINPSTRRQNYEFVDDLEEEIELNSDQRERNIFRKINPSPHLLLEIKHLTTWALLDTGSQITTMSESFYDKLKEKYKLNVLPVSKIFVSTAIGKKYNN